MNHLPKSKSNEEVSGLATLIGLTLSSYGEAMVEDLTMLLENGKRSAADGYVHCMYRLMKRDIAWQLILKAFATVNEKPPGKYASLFGEATTENSLPRVS